MLRTRCPLILQHSSARGGAVATCCWAEAPLKIARMTLTIKLDGNWSSFQLANSAPPLCVTDNAIAPSASMPTCGTGRLQRSFLCDCCVLVGLCAVVVNPSRCTATPRLQRYVPKAWDKALGKTSLNQPKTATIACNAIAPMMIFLAAAWLIN